MFWMIYNGNKWLISILTSAVRKISILYKNFQIFDLNKIMVSLGVVLQKCSLLAHNTVYELKNARLTLTLYSSVQTQPMIHCNMPLEPHRNSDFKTGAGIEKRTKNAWDMAKKPNTIWNPRRWVFWAWNMFIISRMSNFKGYFSLKDALMYTSYGITYLPYH